MSLSRFAAVLWMMVGVSAGLAQTNFYWVSPTDDRWSNPSVWTNGYPAAYGDTNYVLNFLNGGTTYIATNDLGSFLLNQINFSNAAVTILNHPLVFTNDSTTLPQVNQLGDSNATIATAITLGTNTTFAGTGTGTITLSGVMDGDGALVMNGPNYTLALTGTNTFTGGILINSGVLQINTDRNLGAVPGAFAVSNIVINGGTLYLKMSSAEQHIAANRGIAIGNGGATFTNNGNRVYIDGVISDLAGEVGAVIFSAGSYVLQNTNTYSGGTTLQPGSTVVMQFTSTETGGPFGTGTLTLNGGSLRPGTGAATTIVVLSNTVIFAANTTIPTGGNDKPLIFAGPVTLTGDRTLTVNSVTNITISGPITDNGNSYRFTKDGPGTLILTGSNSFSGGITVNNGYLRFDTADSFPTSGAIAINAGALSAIVPDVSTHILSRLSTSSAGMIALMAANANENLDFNTVGFTNLILGAAETLTYGGLFTPFSNYWRLGAVSGATLTFTNPISGGFLEINKIGTGGTVVLTTAANYSGVTTIGGGKLQLAAGDNTLPTNTIVSFIATSALDIGPASQTLSNITFADGVTATITGDSLTLGATDFTIGGASSSGAVQTLTMSGLTNFTYNGPTKNFRVGGQLAVNGYATGTLTLARTNTINAGTVTVGWYTAGTTTINTGLVYLGQVNTINADTLVIGPDKTFGRVRFQSLTSPTLTIRGTNGVSRATRLIIGTGASNVNPAYGLLDLTNSVSGTSTLDALITDVIIGLSTRNSGGGKLEEGAFIMGGGLLDATRIILGTNTVGGTTGGASGLLSLNGGTIKVQTLTLAANVGGSVPVTGQFDLNSGTLLASNIQAGVGVATRDFNWRGGTIGNYDATTDLILTNLVITLATNSTHTFNVDASRTAFVSALLTSTGDVIKTGGGSLLLLTNNTYIGSTTIKQGTTRLGLTDALPTATVLTLGDTASAANGGVLDLNGFSQTVGRLAVVTASATNSTATNFITNIAAGQSLNIVTNATGNAFSTQQGTHLQVSGAGTLNINATNGAITIVGRRASDTYWGVDLSQLGSFSAIVSNIVVGQDPDAVSVARQGLLTLATNNTITANSIYVGYSVGSGNIKGQILLGASNRIEVANLYLGYGKADGTLAVNPDLTGGQLLLAGTNSTRANVTLGLFNQSGSNTRPTGNLIITNTGAAIYANLDQLLIGTLNVSSGNATNGGLGNFTFNAGTVDVNTVILGQSLSGATTGTGAGTLTINGGLLTVNTAFTLANRLGTGNITGTVVFAGGTANFACDILDGGGVSILTLNGGTLDMQGHNIGDAVNPINTLNLQSGTLQNVTEVNGGVSPLTKIGAGTLYLDGTNTYTAGTTISGGLLQFQSTNAMPSTTTITANTGGAVALNVTNLTANLLPKLTNSSAGMLALLAINANENFNFSTGGFTNLILGAAETLTYGGTYTPFSNFWRLGAVTGATLTFTNPISGTGFLEINKGGHGGTVLLTATNTHTGGTTVAGGTLKLGAPNVLPTTGVLTLGDSANGANGGRFDLNGFSQTLDRLLVTNVAGSNATATNSIVNIAAGQTLNVSRTGVIRVVEIAEGAHLQVSGGGTLNVSDPDGTLLVYGYRSTDNVTYRGIDLSQLANFSATVTNFVIGYDGTISQASRQGLLILAATNTITANTMSLGNTTRDGSVRGLVLLGNSNLLRVGTLYLGFGKGAGTLTFNTAFSNSTATITGLAGGRANL